MKTDGGRAVVRAAPGGGCVAPLGPARELALDHRESLLHERHLLAKLGAAPAAVLRVHVSRDGLQKLEQQPLEADERFDFASRRLDQRRGRLCGLVVRGGIPVDVIDEGGVETLLGVERRSHDTPDEPAEPALERASRPARLGRFFQPRFNRSTWLAS